jgi:ATP-binding cassette subfamily C protein CydC
MKPMRAVLDLFWRSDRGTLLAGVALNVATLLAGVALLGLSGWFIAASALAGIAGAGLAFDVFRPSAGIRFLALARTAGRYGERVVTHDATLRFLARFRVALFRGMAHQPLDRLVLLRSAELLERLTADVEALDGLYLRIVLPLASAVLVAVAVPAGAILFQEEVALALVVLGVGGLAVALAAGWASRRTARRHALALEALRVRAVDLVRAQTDLAVAGSLGAQRASAMRAASRASCAARRLNAVDLVTGAALSLAGALAIGGVLILAAASHRAGSIAGPTVAALTLVAFAMLEVLQPLRRGAISFGRTHLAARRVAPLLDRLCLQRQAHPPQGADRTGPPALVFSHVTFRYGESPGPVLAGLDLAIAPGEHVVLAGPSGAGKSTVLALAAGLARPTGGEVLLGGRPVADIAQPERARRVGLLTQRTELFGDTIAENLRLAAPEAGDADLWQALETACLAERVRALPGGLAARLGEGGVGLSGGEARRLALARLALLKPAVWLLDEPTAGLDALLADAVMASVRKAAAGATLVAATHQVAAPLQKCRIISLGSGVESAQGASPATTIGASRASTETRSRD